MTNQGAIKHMKYMLRYAERFLLVPSQLEAINQTIAALEKQEPKERIKPDNEDILDGIEYRCPTCGRAYKKDSRYDYCISCGQHLLWDENCISMMACDGGISK